MHHLKSFPDFAVHRSQQFGAEFVKQSRQQYEQPIVQIVRMRQNQLVYRVQEQRIHFCVIVDEHFTEQFQNLLQLQRFQRIAIGKILRQTGETVFAFGPVCGRTIQ